MPTTAFQTYSNATLTPVKDPHFARLENVNLAASLTLAAGTVLGELTATPGTFTTYASGNSDGSQTPKCILKTACTTDSSGNVTSTGDLGVTELIAAAYYSGTFRTEELTGLDANAVTKLGGRLVMGTTTTGIFRF